MKKKKNAYILSKLAFARTYTALQLLFCCPGGCLNFFAIRLLT